SPEKGGGARMASSRGAAHPDVTTSRNAVMTLAQWQPHVTAAIRQTPWEFDFFQTIRWLQRLRPDRSQTGRFHHPTGEVARYSANPAVSFPASQIQALT